MSAFTIGQQVSCNGVDLRIRSIEGNVLCLEASNGSFFGFRHVSSVKPIECTPAADAALSPAAAVAGGLSVPECTPRFVRGDSVRVRGFSGVVGRVVGEGVGRYYVGFTGSGAFPGVIDCSGAFDRAGWFRPEQLRPAH